MHHSGTISIAYAWYPFLRFQNSVAPEMSLAVQKTHQRRVLTILGPKPGGQARLAVYGKQSGNICPRRMQVGSRIRAPLS